ncbi:hypothetical protein C7S10_21775 [Nocardioides currus]|uniref:Uncharacterized protein n=2 Tax=Nocardioides currus TaxID=2133958 RepID=A0A2R7YRT3_9ACTN|nr:hypothetical protein C7S10_21775 [Nocardioides currus]
MATHALNCTQVALGIWDRFPWVAASNVRVAFEHAFVAQWLFFSPDGPAHFMRVAEHDNHVHSREFSRAIEDQPTLTAQVSADELTDFHAYAKSDMTPGHERSWSMQNLLRELEPSGLLYSSYRALSSAVHPSLGTISAHYDFKATASPQPMRSGEGSADRHEIAQGLALSALWALNAAEKWAADYDEPGRAGAIAIPNNLPYDLSHSLPSATE